MKIKTLLMAMMAIMLLGITAACSDDDDEIKETLQLPSEAKTLISTYFPGAEIIHIKRDGGSGEYDVTLSDRTELDFDRNGKLEEVDCSRSTGRVPDGLMPAAIPEYVSVNYPGQNIVKLDIRANGYETELTNGIELLFDTTGQFIGIDR